MAVKGGVGLGSRASMAVQVLLVTGLALVVGVLLIDAAEWRKLRLRLDLSLSGRNTLDPQTETLLENLPQEATVHVFFRRVGGPLAAVASEVMDDTLELLTVIDARYPEKVEIEGHDPNDLPGLEEAFASLELESEREPFLVVAAGERRVTLRLFDELAFIDPGELAPRERPPAVLRFKGEEALAAAFARVTATEEPRVVFLAGHGEADLYGGEAWALGRLRAGLERDGFVVGEWDPSQGPIPEDAAVLAIIGNEQPLAAPTVEAIHSWVKAGGRLLAAPGRALYDGEGSASELLQAYGMLPARGLICVPFFDAFGRLQDGNSRCSAFDARPPTDLNADHPVTRTLWQAQRRVRFAATRSFERGASPIGGTLVDLISSPEESWRDLPFPNYLFEPDREELGRFRLAMASAFRPREAAQPGEEEVEARVVGLASPNAFTNDLYDVNRDFLLNLFNWLAAREYRIQISTRDPFEGVLDPESGDIRLMFQLAVYYLPGACLLLGIVVWRRRR